MTSQVPADKPKNESIFKLRVKGDYQLAEARSDPSQTKANEEAKAQAEQKKLEQTACEIDASLKERIELGAVTSVTSSPPKSDT